MWEVEGSSASRGSQGPSSNTIGRGELKPLLLHSADAPTLPQVQLPAPGGLGSIPGWGPHPHGPAR